MMNNNASFFNLIDEYLRQRLPRETQEAMDKAIAEDPRLAQEVALRRLEFDVSESIIADDIRSQLAKLREKTASAQAGENRNPAAKRYHWLGITLLLFLFVAGILYFSWERFQDAPTLPPAPEQTFPTTPQPPPVLEKDNAAPTPAENPKPEKKLEKAKVIALAIEAYGKPEFETLRGNEAPTSKLDAAFEAWGQKNYLKCIAEAQKIEKNSPLYVKARYLMAHAQFKAGQYAQSAVNFSSIVDSKILPYAEEAAWFVVPAQIADKSSSREKVKKSMDFILRDPQHPYYENCLRLSRRW